MIVGKGKHLNEAKLGQDYREKYKELVSSKKYLDWVYNPKNDIMRICQAYNTTPLILYLDTISA